MRALTVLAGSLILAAAVPARAAGAQETAQRAALDSIRADFTSQYDSLSLLARERERIQYARAHRDDPLIHLELGYLAFRLGEITSGNKHYDDAAAEFEWAAELRPGWPYPWYWLGVAELAIGEARVIAIQNIREWLGIDALSEAVRDFARALEADPSFSAALVDLANAALSQRISPRLEVAQRALRVASGTPAAHVPAVLLMRGRIERQLDENDSALAAFQAYVGVGGDSGVGGVEIARTLAALGRDDSALAAYDRALRRPVTDSARREIRRDLRWIATPGELAALDAAPADSVYRLVQRFWSGRDVADGRRAGERLLEQFRRYSYGLANFRLASRHRHYDIGDAYRDTTQQELDDRGIIYLRHGDPDLRAFATATDRNESWLYRRSPPDHDLIFHFVARGSVQDYKLVESLLMALGFSGALAAQAGEDPQQALFASRAEFSPIYERLARFGTASRGSLLAEEREEVMRSLREGTNSDSYSLHFAQELRPVVSAFAVADATRRTELHVVFAIPSGRLHGVDAPGGVAYPLSLRLVVFDDALRTVASLDTVRAFRSSQTLVEGTYLTEQVSVRVPAGTYRFNFMVEEPHSDAGALVTARGVEIPRLGAGFTASDVVMGREGSGLLWRRTEGDVPLNPLRRFPQGGDATLYYELYGLPRGASVETRVRIVPAGGRSIFHRLFGGGRGADIAYATVTDAAERWPVRQRLSLAGLGTGRYTLELELTDPTSHTRVVRRQPFEIGSARAP